MIEMSTDHTIILLDVATRVAERVCTDPLVAALRESGVTTLNVAPLANTHAERVALIEQIRDLAA